jgi:hypothetical protein
MSDNEFPTTCKDFQPTTGPLRKGCGQEIVMKKYPDGKWHPHNKDGTPHKHESAPKASPAASQTDKVAATVTKTTTTTVRDRPYYEGVTEIAEVDVQRANNLLKEGWTILRIAEKQGWVLAKVPRIGAANAGAHEQIAQATSIIYILGKRAA